MLLTGIHTNDIKMCVILICLSGCLYLSPDTNRYYQLTFNVVPKTEKLKKNHAVDVVYNLRERTIQ